MKLMRKLEEYLTLLLSFSVNTILYRNKRLSNIKKILVLRLDHIGDLMLSMPCLSSLRTSFPTSYIDIVINSTTKPIAEMIPYVNNVTCYDAKFFDRTGKVKAFDLVRAIEFVKRVRSKKYDLILDLRGSLMTVLLAVMAKAKFRLDRGTYLLLRKIRAIRSGERVYKNEAEMCLDIIAQAGLPVVRETHLRFYTSDITFARSLLKKDRLNFVIHPGGNPQLKRWSLDRYAELIRRILSDYKASVYIIGSSNEQGLASSIMSQVGGGDVSDLCGKVMLRQLPAFLKECDLFIGNDSGPMHIASICGTKVVGLFGPTDPNKFGPFGKNSIALRMEQDCQPCASNKCKYGEYRCIDKISVNDVMHVIKKMLC